MKKSKLDQGLFDAYQDPDLFVLRKNKWTGKTEMIIAGTPDWKTWRGAGQWVQNVAEVGKASSGVVLEVGTAAAGVVGAATSWLGPEVSVPAAAFVELKTAEVAAGLNTAGMISGHFRGEYVDYLEQVAIDNDVEVIYGHSRGAAIMNQMDVPTSTIKIGLDGATALDAGQSNYLNLVDGSDLDHMFTLTGSKHAQVITGRSKHHVTRSASDPAITTRDPESLMTHRSRLDPNRWKKRVIAGGTSLLGLSETAEVVYGESKFREKKKKAHKRKSHKKHKRR
ncbi:MAG: putative esterase/lipase [Bacilladnaviridae sp.]|uniref:Esterase/lipase n=1 Tax=Bacilladnaviridae sp. isolate ctdc18 TaxID=3070177 RepID=A0A345MP95_9VIRU|nr:MAG: putative esterase/lipase [Bacilladnaviridae sp.]AXH73195.1 MAG: putative esterase/lipase [Bacilladnaviridae sp. isolate ctdc18]